MRRCRWSWARAQSWESLPRILAWPAPSSRCLCSTTSLACPHTVRFPLRAFSVAPDAALAAHSAPVCSEAPALTTAAICTVVTGTVLAATTIAAGSTAAAYAAQGVTNLPACLALASTGVFTAAAGSLFSQKVKAPALKRVTGVVLICIAPVIFMGSRSRNTESTRQANDAQSPVADSTEPRNISWSQQAYDIAWTQLPFVVAGSIAGFSQGFIGVGGGLVMTTLMTVGTDLSQHTVIATALSATTLINTSATVMHYRMGHVRCEHSVCRITCALLRTMLPVPHLRFSGSFRSTHPSTIYPHTRAHAHTQIIRSAPGRYTCERLC